MSSSGYPRPLSKHVAIGGQIQRLSIRDVDKVSALLANDQPFIIEDTNFATRKWTVDYLQRHMPKPLYMNVFTGPTPIFRYFDDRTKRILNRGKSIYEFTPPYESAQADFHSVAGQLKKKREDARTDLKAAAGKQSFIYLQDALQLADPKYRKTKMADDYAMDFDWPRMCKFKEKCNWRALTSNTLWMGEQGVVTPCHYDEQYTILGQIQGINMFIYIRICEHAVVYIGIYIYL